MKQFISFILFIFLIQFANAQLESAHWFFGRNAGLDFTSGTPVVDYNGRLSTIEGCASISDYAGNLLFYTDGITVWNTNHQIMQNGTGLLGDPSSSQSAIIVPFPKQSKKYYIFTVGADDNLSDPTDINEGFHYYVVDMDLDSGLGAVESFDNVNNTLLNLTSEKIAATIHPNKTDYWLLTHFRDSFYAYKITAGGIQSPIITSIGPYLSEVGYPVNSRGYLKISPDGTKIGIAHLSYLLDSDVESGNSTSDNAAPGYLAVYDFNPLTGIVSNEIVLNKNTSGELEGTPYGLEFSPNSQLLYAELDYNNPLFYSWEDSELIQYNLTSSPVSRVVLTNGTTFSGNGTSLQKARGALQLALDNKIYYSIPKTDTSFGFYEYIGTSLSIIHSPNTVGVGANFTYESLLMNTPSHPNTYVTYGLPPFVSSFFVVEIVLDGDIIAATTCEEKTVGFRLETNATISSILWDFGDGNTSNLLEPTHSYTSPGEYNIHVLITDLDGVTFETNRTITILPNPSLNNAILTECDGNGDGLSRFDLSNANAQIITNPENYIFTYHTTFGLAESGVDENALPAIYNNVVEDQTVYARVENENGCFSIAEILLDTTDQLLLESNGLSICDDDYDGFETFYLPEINTVIENNLFPGETIDIVSYHSSIIDAENQENALPDTYTNNTPNQETVYARVENGNDCEALVTFPLNVWKKPIPDLENAINCESDAHTFTIADIFNSYNWEGLSPVDASQPTNQPSITVTQEGTYILTVTNGNGCEGSTSVTLTYSERPIITSVSIFNMVNVTINASGKPTPLMYSLDGINWQTSPTFNNLTPGVHYAYIKNNLGCEGDPYPFGIIDIPNIITPNSDGYNDVWNIPGLAAYPNSRVQIFDRYGKLMVNQYIEESNSVTPISTFDSPSLSSTQTIWDGYYLGRKVPTTSYWYIIEVTDGRKYTGWLTVKNY